MATIGDRTLTVSDLENRINQSSPASRARYASMQAKKEFLDGQVRLELLAAEAERRGFDQDFGVLLATKRTMNRKLLKDRGDAEAFIKSLMEKANVNVDESKLAKVQVGALSRDPKELAETLATVDGVPITVGAVEYNLNKHRSATERFASMESKRDLVSELIVFEVEAQEAKRRGLDKDLEVLFTAKQRMVQRLIQDESEKITANAATDSDCKKYFDAHASEFNKPEERRVAWILTQDEAVAKKALADSRSRGVDSMAYRQLVSEYSLDQATKGRGGVLGYFSQSSKDASAEIIEAAFKLKKVGDNSPAFKTKQGYAFVKLMDRRVPVIRTFDEVKEQIRGRLLAERTHNIVEECAAKLLKQVNVKIDESKLAQVRVSAQDSSPIPGAKGSPPTPQGLKR